MKIGTFHVTFIEIVHFQAYEFFQDLILAKQPKAFNFVNSSFQNSYFDQF